jgi:hypothetical protein
MMKWQGEKNELCKTSGGFMSAMRVRGGAPPGASSGLWITRCSAQASRPYMPSRRWLKPAATAALLVHGQRCQLVLPGAFGTGTAVVAGEEKHGLGGHTGGHAGGQYGAC